MDAVSAYVFVNTRGARQESLLAELAKWPEVKKINIVTGPYDMVLLVLVDSLDILRDFLIRRLQLVDGIEKTLTSVIIQ